MHCPGHPQFAQLVLQARGEEDVVLAGLLLRRPLPGLLADYTATLAALLCHRRLCHSRLWELSNLVVTRPPLPGLELLWRTRFLDEVRGGVALGVPVNDHHRLAQLRQRRRQVHHRRGFAHAALEVEGRNPLAFPVSKRCTMARGRATSWERSEFSRASIGQGVRQLWAKTNLPERGDTVEPPAAARAGRYDGPAWLLMLAVADASSPWTTEQNNQALGRQVCKSPDAHGRRSFSRSQLLSRSQRRQCARYQAYRVV